MLGKLLEQIENALDDKEQGRREGSVNIIVGNSGTVIIGDGHSLKASNDADLKKKQRSK